MRTSERHPSPLHSTYLHTYIQLAFTDVCVHISEALVKAGARVDLRNAASASPLHLAAQKSHPGVVRVLIAAGADRAQRDAQVCVCCSVLQCVAVCCGVLQYVAVDCSALQWVAVGCSLLQCDADIIAAIVDCSQHNAQVCLL